MEGTFDAIVVHSYSRVFRDAFGLEFYVGKLEASRQRRRRASSVPAFSR